MSDMNFGEPSSGGFIDTHFDFARCQRPDGSFYGTGGVCRKGTQTEAKAAVKKVKIMTKEQVAKASDAQLRSQVENANKAGFGKGADQSPAVMKGLKEQHDLAKAELRMRASGNTKATAPIGKGNLSPKDRAKAEKAAAMRKVAANMKPKVKELDKNAKSLNQEANRLDKAFRRQAKITQKNPTKENKARLRTIRDQTRQADRAAKKADRAADKASKQMEQAMRKAAR